MLFLLFHLLLYTFVIHCFADLTHKMLPPSATKWTEKSIYFIIPKPIHKRLGLYLGKLKKCVF